MKKLDYNVDNGETDVIVTTLASSGTITIDSFNIIGSLDNITDNTYKYQILKTSTIKMYKVSSCSKLK